MRQSRHAPVILMPKDALVLDMSTGPIDIKPGEGRYGIGRYGEKRKGVYTTPLFQAPDGQRNIHLGIDLFCPIGTPVHAFSDGWIHLFGYNPAAGDYGYTLITRHELVPGSGEVADEKREIFALHGHLNRASVEGKVIGRTISKGEVIAWVGAYEENGGWPEHLHFQLSWDKPLVPDMPGTATAQEWEKARLQYPDPESVLGPSILNR